MRYVRIDTFALGSAGGGRWSSPVVVSGKDAPEAFKAALDVVQEQGFASSTKLSFCKKNGDNFE